MGLKKRTIDMDLAMKEVLSLKENKGKHFYKTKKLERIELSVPSINYIMSGKYSGEDSGFPLGRIINIYGDFSNGKTAMAGTICRDIINKNGRILWIDGGEGFDEKYMGETYGVKHDPTKNVHVAEINTLEQCTDMIYAYVANDAVDLIVVDSVSSLAVSTQLVDAADAFRIGAHSRRISEMLQKVSGYLSASECSIIFINQERTQINGSMPASKTFTGGKAMRFYPAINIHLETPQKANVMKEGMFIHKRVTATCKKNKTATPFLTAELTVVPYVGFSRFHDIISIAVDNGVISNKGAWYYYDDYKWQGSENMREVISKTEGLLDKIWADTQTYLNYQINYETGEIINEEQEIAVAE
jgi:recombination protein RecA